jgi:hypothetical protein
MVIVPSAQNDNEDGIHRFPLSIGIRYPHVFLLHQGLIGIHHFHRRLILWSCYSILIFFQGISNQIYKISSNLEAAFTNGFILPSSNGVGVSW